ncbi:MAG: UDP-N-acetylmuramoyl-tripeptide--D-alanyl-D-alanine ligase [Firmicutes bacterium]|jgi:UDP-N-acetylmuramoyl-tripeptide--D-alanyl-D-alanine ligase|nr:UDP-N-acetylmuramoyl-tripeptide--D-alanyl-D-alanine ligase [Bacillota bacterium]
MLGYDLSEVARAVGGSLLAGAPSGEVKHVTVDTRLAGEGCLFFALRGEHADGHDFLDQAVARGAVGAVVSVLPKFEAPEQFGLILVPDTLSALGRLAAYHRSRQQAKVVGVTGSAGKTTTKDMIASVLETEHRVLATSGNMNNEIGMPLTLLGLRPDHDVAVVEMAMRGPGQIADLARIARPDVGVVTNVGDAHIEFFGTRNGIARAKGELITSLPVSGLAVLNGDDPFTREMRTWTSARSILFGFAEGNDVRADEIQTGEAGVSFSLIVGGEPLDDTRFTVPLPGRHNVLNALAALAVGVELGVSPGSMASGLLAFTPSDKRMHFVSSSSGYTIVDDTYNANPDSMKCAVTAAIEYAAGRRVIVVFGNMLELGGRAEAAHREVGRHVFGSHIDAIITVGDLAAIAARAAVDAGMDPRRAVVCATNREAALAVASMAEPGDVVLVKGSRGMRMEEIVSALAGEARTESGGRP